MTILFTEKAMQYRAWRRKTGGQHKVDAPLPRPKTANAVKWRTTFKQAHDRIRYLGFTL